MVRLSQRREMARWAVQGQRTNIRHACRTFAVSETCFRYEAVGSPENSQIADWLVRLTTAYRDSGFGLWLIAPAQREGLWLEPQVGVSHLSGVGVESADQAQEAIDTGASGATGSARLHQPSMVDGLHARPAQ